MSEVMTLADFLSTDSDKLPLQLAAGFDKTPDLSSVKTLLMTKFSSAQWTSVVQAVAGKVGDLLRVQFTTILARAWKDLKQVQEAIETTRQSPGRTELVPLADHTIESEHRPHLDLYKDGKLIHQITFLVSLEIELRALVLEIEKGAIRKIGSGDAQIKGTLKFGDCTLVEKASEPVRIPWEIQLDTTADQAAG
jgi:hypothetical protein